MVVPGNGLTALLFWQFHLLLQLSLLLLWLLLFPSAPVPFSVLRSLRARQSILFPPPSLHSLLRCTVYFTLLYPSRFGLSSSFPA